MANANKTVVMLVDDDKDILQTVRKGLENLGYEVHGFSDSVKALEHIENGCKECQMFSIRHSHAKHQWLSTSAKD